VLLNDLERFALRGKALLERHVFAALAGVSLLYVGCTVTLAAHKQMWNDELFTYYLALLPNASTLRHALLTGAEQIPPTFHLLTRGAFALFGTGQVAIRLPEIAAFLIMMLCLYRFVTAISSPFYGLIGMVTPLVTDAYRYAYEARPYALVLGFSGLALVCWQESTGPRRPWAIGGLVLALAATLSSHYYGVLTFAGIGIGQVIRSWKRGKLDVPLWAALGVGAAVPILAFWPFITRAAGYASTFSSPPSRLGQVLDFYRQLLLPGTSPLEATLLLAAAYGLTVTPSPSSESPVRYAWADLGAGFGFAVVPAIAFALGKVATHAFVHRYALASVLGISILLALVVYYLPRGRAVVGMGYLVLVIVWFPLAQRNSLRTLDEDVSVTNTAIDLLRAQDDRLPIVASEPHIFMTLAHYAPPEITSRLVYLTDPAASLRHLGHNSVDRGMSELIGPWFHLPVQAYAPFLRSHRTFLVYGNLGWLNWVTTQLCEDHRVLELQSRVDEDYLFLVHDPETASEDRCEVPTHTDARKGD
jgi:Dolichyl-phosphate-mannose-protein mannosyltransferase